MRAWTVPHYTFEVTAWFGLAIVAQQLNVCLVFAGMASYLSGRAVATTKWYRQQFGEAAVPLSKRHLVPYVF